MWSQRVIDKWHSFNEPRTAVVQEISAHVGRKLAVGIFELGFPTRSNSSVPQETLTILG
jgi:hypothetical protein